MAMLESISEDCTYKANEGCLRLADISQTDGPTLYGYDLKNFTDYLPLSLQLEVVKEL